MGMNSNKAGLFSHWLRGQMIHRKLSNRALGRLIDPEQPERGRRQVLRHLSGKHFPNARTRSVYIEVFELDGDPFSDDDEEEDQSLAAELRFLAARLKRLERRQAIPRALNAAPRSGARREAALTERALS